jgi:hypothetical protein
MSGEALTLPAPKDRNGVDDDPGGFGRALRPDGSTMPRIGCV